MDELKAMLKRMADCLNLFSRYDDDIPTIALDQQPVETTFSVADVRKAAQCQLDIVFLENLLERQAEAILACRNAFEQRTLESRLHAQETIEKVFDGGN